MVDAKEKEEATAKELVESLKDALLERWLFEEIEGRIAKSYHRKRERLLE